MFYTPSAGWSVKSI